VTDSPALLRYMLLLLLLLLLLRHTQQDERVRVTRLHVQPRPTLLWAAAAGGRLRG